MCSVFVRALRAPRTRHRNDNTILRVAGRGGGLRLFSPCENIVCFFLPLSRVFFLFCPVITVAARPRRSSAPSPPSRLSFLNWITRTTAAGPQGPRPVCGYYGVQMSIKPLTIRDRGSYLFRRALCPCLPPAIRSVRNASGPK